MESIFTQDHFILSDEEFVRQFQSLTLNPAWFTHVAHLRLAWIYIRNNSTEEAASKLCDQIAAFDQKFGSGNRFNHTVTTAFTKMIAFHQQLHPADNFQTFIIENPALIDSYRSLFEAHYSYDVFKTEEARFNYLEPDLKPFPIS